MGVCMHSSLLRCTSSKMSSYRDPSTTLCLLLLLLLMVVVLTSNSNSIDAFSLLVIPSRTMCASWSTQGGGGGAFVSASRCSMKLDGKKGGDGVSHPSALAIGTFVEFEEKSREHVGKITTADNIKGSGGGGSTRYHVVDSNGKMYDIPDKAIMCFTAK